jgi:hypothetical protein
VPPRSTVQVTVTLHVGVPAGLPEAEFQAASGLVVLTPTAGSQPELRVPYLLVAKSTSLIEASPEEVEVPRRGGDVEVTVVNRSPVPGTADVYALGMVDGANDEPARGGAADVRRVGVQSFPGVQPFPDEPDAVVGLDFGFGAFGAPNGIFASFTIDLGNTSSFEDDTIVRVLGAGGAFNSSVVSLPFILSDVGLGDADGNFTYTSAVFGLLGAGVDIVSGEGSYDAVDQPVETGQFAVLPGGATDTISAAVDRRQLRRNPVPGLLVVFQQNPTGLAAADVVAFS